MNSLRHGTRALVALGGITLALALSVPCDAMTFKVITLGGEPAIVGMGEIGNGDAERLKKVLVPSSRHSMGYFALVLSSPGGSVRAAFELSTLMDQHNINTYVPSGAVCASSCAAIVFIAGREHVVVGDGILAFHGCYDAKTRKIVDLCNEKIAEHAVEHGTSYGSIMAFIQSTPADQVVTFGAVDASCWGISKYVISPTPLNYERCVVDAINEVVKGYKSK